MNFLPLFLSFPIFICLMVVESTIARRQRRVLYDYKETVSNILCGLGHVGIDLLVRSSIFVFYSALYSVSPWKISTGFTSVVALFILVDFLKYWFHRASHTNRILWMVHRVHHQSKFFNYSVGLRLPWFHKFFALVIYIPPALLGFSGSDYIIVATIHAVAQIWNHTELYSLKTSKIRYLLITPALHQVHHATNKEYLNRNYGGIFSFWDRLFGSYIDPVNDISITYGVNDNIYPQEENRVFASNYTRLKDELFSQITARSENKSISNTKVTAE